MKRSGHPQGNNVAEFGQTPPLEQDTHAESADHQGQVTRRTFKQTDHVA